MEKSHTENKSNYEWRITLAVSKSNIKKLRKYVILYAYMTLL